MGKYRKYKPGKLGPNEPCFCGSGVKYKKCCRPKGLLPPRPIEEVPAEVLAHFEKLNAMTRARQEKGIYINLPNTISFKGRKLLGVGNKIMLDKNEHATFHELILRNLQMTLGEEWWNTETAKPLEEQHFIRRCFSELNTPIMPEQDWQQESEHLHSMLPTGHQQAVMSLAFDVYVLQHKNSLPEDWLERLRSYDQYQGVRYEIMVASIFARIGCMLEFFDDKTVRSKHAEFIATHAETGNRVVVEAKSRQRPGVIHAPGTANLRKAMLGDVTKLFNRALKKDRQGLPYVIFIDVNAPPDVSKTTLETRWFADIRKMMDARGEPTRENPESYSLLCVTNYSPHYEGNRVTATGGVCVVGSLHTENPFVDGVQGEFMNRIVQASTGYGYIPNL